jgi:hypothetical protein
MPLLRMHPSKARTCAASVLRQAARAGRLTGKSAVGPDWTVLASQEAEMSERWDDAQAADRLKGGGTTLLRSHGRITGPADVEQRHRGYGQDPAASGYPGHQLARGVPAAGVPAVRASPRGARMPRGLQAARPCLRGDKPDRQDMSATGKDRDTRRPSPRSRPGPHHRARAACEDARQGQKAADWPMRLASEQSPKSASRSAGQPPAAEGDAGEMYGSP